MILHWDMWTTLTSHAEVNKSLPWSKYLSFEDCGNENLRSANWIEDLSSDYTEEKAYIKFKLSLLVIHLLYLFVLEIFLRWTITVTIGKGYELCICIGFCAYVQ